MFYAIFDPDGLIANHRLIMKVLLLIVAMTWVSGLQAAEPFFVLSPELIDDQPAYRVFGVEQALVVSRDGLWIRTILRPAEDEPTAPTRIVKLGFEGANDDRVLEPFDRRQTSFSYFSGSEPSRWHNDLPVWGGVRIRALYPGIDLEVTSVNGRLVQRIVTKGGTNLGLFRMRLEGADYVGADGDGLILEGGGALRPPPILISGEDAGLMLPTGWPRVPRKQSNQVQTSGIGDPVMSTFLGGSGEDCHTGCKTAVDGQGNIYIAGMTESANFPTTPGVFDEGPPVDLDAFVAKLTPDGASFDYVTLIAGSFDDEARAIAVDAAGCVHITGRTPSNDFPTTLGAYDRTHNGGYYPDDAFVVKINANGTDLVYATYLGSGSTDFGNAIRVDASGDIFVTGTTLANGFPTTSGAYDTSYNPPNPQGESDAFFVKLSPDGNGSADLLYGTYLGGGADESARGLAVDASGNVYLTGSTSSSDFPSTAGAWDPSFNGNTDAFVLKLSPGGNGAADLVYGSFLGHADSESGSAVAVDSSGSAVVLGYTMSSSFPTTSGAFDTLMAGDNDLFVTRFNAAGSALLFSTLVGGYDIEYAGGVQVDAVGNIVACGGTKSGNFPTTYQNAFDQTLGGTEDAVFFVLDGDGSSLLYSSFYGGSETDFGFGVALGRNGDAVMVGRTRSAGFPMTPGAAQAGFGGGSCFGGQPCNDAFITRIPLSMIFADGFESGNLDLWTTSMP